MHSRRKAKLRVASDGGRGVYRWPGRQMLPTEQLSNAELRALALDPNAPPSVQRIARLNYGGRIRRRWRAIKARLAGGKVVR